MKKTSLTLISLLALSGTVFGQTASDLVTSSSGDSGTHQFTESGRPADLELCSYELCHLDENGTMKIAPVAAGSISAIIAQASQPDAEKYLVFYPAGQSRNPDARRVLRTRYLVTLEEGADLDAIKSRCGMKSIKLVRAGSNLALCEEDSAGRVLGQLTEVLNDPEIAAAEPIFAKKRFKRLVPSDPFYSDGGRTDDQYQWYLNNIGANGGVPDVDINLEAALDTRTGAGVTVSIVDDGIATDHLDLVDNATGPHLNIYDDGDADDPSTFDTTANHGTAVAGLVGAAYNNGEGISGSAPEATLAGVRLLSGPDLIDDADEAEALGFSTDVVDVSNNSWGPSDVTLDLEGPGELVLDALEDGAQNGRDSNGVVYVWAAGNGGDIADRSDYDGYANSKYTIAVGALDDSGAKSNFSEEGSNLVVVAPSNGGAQGILTTSFGLGVDDDDNVIRTSEYVTDFGGTSASAPLVSGVVALMLEENPDLNWREVQDVLIRSAVKVDANDGDWIDNAAGIPFNHKYGAGLVDAAAAVALARVRRTEDPIGPADAHLLSRFFSSNSADPAIQSGEVPDNDGSSLLVTYDMSKDLAGNDRPNLRVEHVEFVATIITQSRTDLEIVLISPNGTQSVLHAVDADNTEQSISRWAFMSVRNWGEGSAGTWVVRVTDLITGNAAVLNNATLVINGTEDVDAPVAQVPLLTSSPLISVDQGADFVYNLETSVAASVAVGDLPDGVVFDPATNTISGASVDAGLFSVPIVLIDGDGAQGDFNINIVVRPTAVALGDAVGFSGFPAVFGGDRPWNFELVDTNDGGALDASSARSAAGLLDGESSIFGFDNIGSGVLMFDWKTSSEEGFDRLWFNRGGEVPQVWDAFISGQRDWGRAAVLLPDASNDIRWIYSKDESLSGGEDRGLVDNLELVTLEKYMEDLEAAVNLEGIELELNSRTLFFPIEFPLGSPDAAGNNSLIQSSSVGNGQTVSLAGWVEGPGTLSFSGYNFAEESDLLELLIDGVVASFIEGDGFIVGPLNEVITTQAIPAGRHRFEIRFRKDFTGAAAREIAGDVYDWIFLDDLKYIPTSNFATFVAANGPGFDVDPLADGDGDGYSNYQEYAFGGDVMVSDIPRYLPKIVTSGSNRYVEYGIDGSRTDLDYVAQQSSDLTTWVDAELSSLDRTEGDVEVYRIPLVGGPGRSTLFFRVVADER